MAVYDDRCRKQTMNTADMGVLRWVCGLTRRDKVANEDTRTIMLTANIKSKLQEQRSRWYHIMGRSLLHPTRQALMMELTCTRARGAQKKRWKDTTSKDKTEVTSDDT